ncbi:hypothetical protein A3843_02650 [Pseudovibrio exalbescens]|uniref:Uncharacterized protein n=1 Tax=Pseudovibrio exalbescens TaxID=197461 RepID=A0A1U7JKK5_9HYPH|nr:hypothetical protein A3843_02650 [Pseudovibrio exalbescens]
MARLSRSDGLPQRKREFILFYLNLTKMKLARRIHLKIAFPALATSTRGAKACHVCIPMLAACHKHMQALEIIR